MRALLFCSFIFMGFGFFIMVNAVPSFIFSKNDLTENLIDSVHLLKIKNIKLETQIKLLSKSIDMIKQKCENQHEILTGVKHPDPIVILELGDLPDLKIISGRSNSSDGTIYGFKISEIKSKSALDIFYPTKELRIKIDLKIDRLKDLNEEGMVDRFDSTIQTFGGNLVAVSIIVLKTSDGFLVTTGENKNG